LSSSTKGPKSHSSPFGPDQEDRRFVMRSNWINSLFWDWKYDGCREHKSAFFYISGAEISLPLVPCEEGIMSGDTECRWLLSKRSFFFVPDYFRAGEALTWVTDECRRQSKDWC
jgi:hypothetical protein